MQAAYLLWCALLVTTLAAPAPESAAPSEPPAELELFANEDWYKGAKGPEQPFVGVLRAVPGPQIGFGRFNPYRLQMDKDVREVYVGGRPELLKPYVNRRVEITGKAVEMAVEGRVHREIWPARLKRLPEPKGKQPVSPAAVQ